MWSINQNWQLKYIFPAFQQAMMPSRSSSLRTKIIYENVHPNLNLVLLFVRTEVKCGKRLCFLVKNPINSIGHQIPITQVTQDSNNNLFPITVDFSPKSYLLLANQLCLFDLWGAKLIANNSRPKTRGCEAAA